ncbi:MAG: PHP domain-containing protein, partial [Maricaulis sp.]|nr:PHP domain-containing protein [Maricaulis sp.]
MAVKQPFVHLRVRSPYSLLEGAIRIPQMVDACVSHAMPAIALTDTNNLYGALEFSEYLSAAGVQPIIGCTLSIRLGKPHPGERAESDGSIAVLVQNEAGYQNMMALTSAAFLDVEPTEMPHIPLALLLERSEGLIVLTGGPEGALNQLL